MERVQATTVAIVRAVARDTSQRRSVDEGANAAGWLGEIRAANVTRQKASASNLVTREGPSRCDQWDVACGPGQKVKLVSLTTKATGSP